MAYNKLSNYRTNIMATDGLVSVIYASTMIVEVKPDTITLDTGGYKSVTTKRKMNQASHQFGLGYSVYQKDFTWYVCKPNGETVEFDGKSITFDRS